jgi:type VI secretion system secreted protein Hcp
MRTASAILAASTLCLLAGCGGSPDAADGTTETVQSPLEATGQVQFYATVTGAKQGAFRPEATAAGHTSEIAAFRFFWDATSPTDSATGQATGKATYSPIQITKAFGNSDPQFLTALSTNEVLTVKLTFVKPPQATGMVQNLQTIELTNARVTDLQRATIDMGDTNHTSMLADQISLTFQKLTLTDADGTTTAVVNN